MNVRFVMTSVFVYTRDAFCPTALQRRLSEAREGERTCLSLLGRLFSFLFTMAESSKKRRISHVNNSSQTSSSRVANMLAGSQPDGTGGEGHFVEGSILRITMKNFL